VEEVKKIVKKSVDKPPKLWYNLIELKERKR
jgi:hypothetical protein